MNKQAFIKAIDFYLPERVLDNHEIARMYPSWSSDSILEKIGIEKRHIAAENETTADMAISAVDNLFHNNSSIKKEDIDFFILCTQTPDFEIPTSACYIQHKLGLRKDIGAFDFNLGCSGFVYGLSIAKGLIETGQAKNILLVTSETYSKRIHPEDFKNISLFGDAAAATLISSEISEGVLAGQICNFQFGTDGEGYDKLIHFKSGIEIQSKKEKYCFEYSENSFGDDYLYMDGRAIFEFTLSAIPKLINYTVEKNDIEKGDVNLYVMHQANQFMLDAIRKRAKIPVEQFYISMKDKGNTVSSTIPLALFDALRDGSIKDSSNVLIAGFGVGLSMAGCLIKFALK